MPYDVTASLSTWALVFSVCVFFPSKSTRFARITGHDYRHAALFDLKSWFLPTPVIIVIIFFKLFIWLPWNVGDRHCGLNRSLKMSLHVRRTEEKHYASICLHSVIVPRWTFAVGRTLKSTYYLIFLFNLWLVDVELFVVRIRTSPAFFFFFLFSDQFSPSRLTNLSPKLGSFIYSSDRMLLA